jgi:gamma-carbonic anhydrase
VLLEHRGDRPKVHETAYVAPNATLCGDVTVGENARVMFGAAPDEHRGQLRGGGAGPPGRLPSL